MTRVSKAILIGVTGLVCIGAVLVLGINLYVQSPGPQARIQAELSKALNLPLTLTNTSVTPWSDLRINGIAVPGPVAGQNFLEASTFSARYRFWPLLGKKLIITEMCVESPKIVWVANVEGNWVLPVFAGAVAAKKADKPKQHREKAAGFEVVLETIRMRNGSLELRDFENKPVALFADLDVICTAFNGETASGTLTAGRIGYGEGLALENARSPFENTPKGLNFPALEAGLSGGTVKGRIHLKPSVKNTPFDAALVFENVDAGRLSGEAGWTPGQISGTLFGQLDLRGSFGKFSRSEGKGQLKLVDGLFRQLEFFQTIGQLLQLEELSNLHFKSASTGFHLAEEKVFIDELVLEALDLKLSAQGSVRLDGKLAIDARLAIQQKLVKKLPGFVRDNLTETDAAGTPAIAFKITGKTDRPRTDLADKVIGKKLGDQFEDLVSGIFGNRKKKDDAKKKKKKEQKSPDGVEPMEVTEGENPEEKPSLVRKPAVVRPAVVTPEARP